MSFDSALVRLNLLVEFLSECAEVIDFASLLRVVGGRIRWIVGFDRCTLGLRRGEEVLYFTVTRTEDQLYAVTADRVPAEHATLLGRALDSGTPSSQSQPVSAVCNPLLSGDAVIGAICFSSERESYSYRDSRFGYHIAQCVSSALTRLDLKAREQAAHAEAKSALTHIEALFLHAPIPIAVLRGPDLVFELANAEYCKLTGRSNLVGRTLRAAFPEWETLNDALPPIAMLEGVYRTGEIFSAPEYPAAIDRNGDGTLEEMVFSFVVAPTKDVAGEVVGLMVAAIEITDQVRAREALEWTLAERTKSDELREQLLGIVGHDLRTPISAIAMGAALMLQRGTLEDIEAKTAALIARTADRMAKMVSQLLDFTHARLGGGIPIARTSVELAHVCADVIAEYEIARPDRILRLDPDIDTEGLWDSERLAQVVTNLIGNAIQHGEPSRPIDLRVSDQGADVCLTVHNDGPPISVDVLSSIFDPFRRGKVRDTSKTESLGLGLFISREMVHAHGGELEVQSTEAAGTTFTVRLPRKPPPDPVGR